MTYSGLASEDNVSVVLHSLGYQIADATDPSASNSES
jgi:hypothetical protein